MKKGYTKREYDPFDPTKIRTVLLAGAIGLDTGVLGSFVRPGVEE